MVKRQKQTKAAQKQKQTQIVNVHIGSKRPRKKRAAKKDAAKKGETKKGVQIIPAFNPPPIINFPPGFGLNQQSNAWATPSPPSAQRQHAVFPEDSTSAALGANSAVRVPLTFETSLPRAASSKTEVSLTVPAEPLFDPPPVVEFNEPDPTAAESGASAADRGAALVASAGSSVNTEKELAGFASAAEENLAKSLETAALTAPEIATPAVGAFPFAPAFRLPTEAEIAQRRSELGPVTTRPVEADWGGGGGGGGGSGAASLVEGTTKKTRYVLGDYIPPEDRDTAHYSYNREGYQYVSAATGTPAKARKPKAEEPGATTFPPLFPAPFGAGLVYPQPDFGYAVPTFLGQPAAAEKEKGGLERGRRYEPSSRGRSSSAAAASSDPFAGSSVMSSGISPAEAMLFVEPAN